MNGFKSRSLRWGKVIAGIFIIILCTWIFRLYTNPDARGWQNDSEALVWGKIIKLETGEYSKTEFFFLGSYQFEFEDMGLNAEHFTQGTEPDTAYLVYESQTGAQGILFYLLAEAFRFLQIDGYHIKRLLWILNTSAFVCCFALLCKWIAKEWGKVAAVLALSLLVVSYWLTLSMSNLYWVTWTILLPTVITAYWCQDTNSSSKQIKWVVLLSLAFLVRFMCGFEFASTIMVSSEVPVVYYFFKNVKEKANRRKYFRLAVTIGIIAILMFVAALTVWFVELVMCHDQAYAVNRILETIAKRTGAFENMTVVPEAMVESLEANRFQVVGMYLTSEKMWGLFGIKELVLAELLLKAVSLIRKRSTFLSAVQEIVVLVVAALAPISWYFLASGHSYIHTTIDPLLWLFPFVPICLAYIGKNAVALFESRGMRKETSCAGE